MVMITNSFDKFPKQPTGLMYEQFGKIGINPATSATYETETFTPNWDQNTTGTTNIAVANSRVEYDVTDSGTSQSTLVYDLGTASISETSWVLRGKCVIDNYNSTSGSSCHFFCGLSNGSKTVAFDGSQNSISFAIGVGTADTAYYLGSSVNGAMYSMTSQTSGNITHTPTAETVYFEIIRNNATSATIKLYTDSTYTTSPAGYSRTLTLSSAPTGLRYLVFKSRDRSISGNSLDGHVDDLEFYNGITSVESASPKVKQHFIEWFSGKQLPSYWNVTAGGNGSTSMADEINGGLKLTTSSSSSDSCMIHFNNITQFSPTSGTGIFTVKRNTIGQFRVGFASPYALSSDLIAIADWSTSANKQFMSKKNGTWSTATNSSLSTDTLWHTYKIDLTSTVANLTTDGVFDVTQSVNVDSDVQPFFQMEGTSATSQIRYMECYNR